MGLPRHFWTLFPLLYFIFILSGLYLTPRNCSFLVLLWLIIGFHLAFLRMCPLPLLVQSFFKFRVRLLTGCMAPSPWVLGPDAPTGWSTAGRFFILWMASCRSSLLGVCWLECCPRASPGVRCRRCSPFLFDTPSHRWPYWLGPKRHPGGTKEGGEH